MSQGERTMATEAETENKESEILSTGCPASTSHQFWDEVPRTDTRSNAEIFWED